MVLLTSVSAILAFSSTALASSSQASVFRKLTNVPKGWTKQANLHLDKDNEGMQLKVYLKQPRLAEFQDLALRIATPDDEMYGKHLEQHEIDAMLAPESHVVDQVVSWLNDAGLSGAKPSERGDAVVVMASVSDAEKLLNAKYEHFVHQETGQKTLGTLEYSLPSALQQHIELVSPSTFFGFPKKGPKTSPVKPASTETSQAGCSGYGITPSCLSSLYNYGGAKSYSNGRMGIAGFLEEYPSQSDLRLFMNRYATENNADQTYTCQPINGGRCPSTRQGGLEANLDVQYARAITERIPNTYYSTGGRPPQNGVNDNEPYLEFLNYLLGLPKDQLPQTMSISYADTEPSVPVDYQKKTCDLFSQLGAKGVSVFVASGDFGVGQNCPGGRYVPEYPSDCPWITAVGGTDGTSPERAWSGSGGGFSNVFPRPSWQDEAVQSWMQSTGGGGNGNYNSSGRAYPDVAAQATNFQVVIGGNINNVYGTSAACPTFASIIQLINSDRLSTGKAPLGFLNPWLYSKAASALHDITSGYNTGCNNGGFNAVRGWDPVTGLGTPDFEALLRISQSS